MKKITAFGVGVEIICLDQDSVRLSLTTWLHYFSYEMIDLGLINNFYLLGKFTYKISRVILEPTSSRISHEKIPSPPKKLKYGGKKCAIFNRLVAGSNHQSQFIASLIKLIFSVYSTLQQVFLCVFFSLLPE